MMPDSIVSACTTLDGVRVIWISRYAAGGNLFLDLEAVEELTANPAGAINRLIDLLPMTFRADWGALVRRGGDGSGARRHATPAAPAKIDGYDVGTAALAESGDDATQVSNEERAVGQ